MPDFKPVPPRISGYVPEPDPPGKLKPVAPSFEGRTTNVYGRNPNYTQNQADFRFQLKTNADNEKLRAQDQGGWESAGIKLLNLVPNIVLGLGEIAGYTGALLSETGTDRDYTNALTELMQKAKDPFGEVYLENPNETFDLTDSAWWINHIGNLAESATEFAVPGALLGKSFKALVSAAAIGRKSLLVGDALAQAGTAATLAYTEGAMSGYTIYEKTFNEQYQKGLNEGLGGVAAVERAKGIAAEAASTTVQLNTLMNTALNLTALGTLFKRSEDEIMAFMKANAKPLAGETAEQFTKRMGTMAVDSKLLRNRKGISSYTGEALQEGLEEVNTQYAEAAGTRVGEGAQKDLIGSLTDIGQALDDVTNQEGALNFILGAFGGMAQTAIIDNIPIHRIAARGPDGTLLPEDQKKTTLVSSRTRNADGTSRYFDNIVKAVAEDINWQQKKMTELAAAKKAGNENDAERIRMEMFDVLALNSVQMGMGEQWINTFKEIANTDNTVTPIDVSAQLDALNEQMAQATDPDVRTQIQAQKDALLDQAAQPQESDAMKKGLAANLQDNSYKERAQEAIADIKHYQKLHDDIYGKYNTDMEQSLGVADYLYHQAARLYREKRRLAQGESLAIKLEDEYNILYGNNTDDTVGWHQSAQQVQNELETQSKVIARIKQDMEGFNKAIEKGDVATQERILDKYKIIGTVGDVKTAKALQKMMSDQVAYASRRQSDAVTQLTDGVGYQEFLKENPGKTLKDYSAFLNAKYGKQSQLTDLKAVLQELRGRTEVNQAALNNLMADPDNVQEVIRKLKPEIEKDRRKLQEDARKAEIEKELARTASAAHVELNRTSLAARKAELEGELAAVTKGIAETETKIKQVSEKLNKLNVTEHSIWNLKWKAKMLLYQGQLYTLNATLHDKKRTQLALQDALRINSAEFLNQQTTAQNDPTAQGTPPVPPAPESAPTSTPPPPTPTPGPAAKTVLITPAAKSLAESNGIDITTITPTGRNGKQIVKADVEAAIAARTAAEKAAREKEDLAQTDAIIEGQAEYLAILDEQVPGEVHESFAEFEKRLRAGEQLTDQDFMELESVKYALQQGYIQRRSPGVFSTLRALREFIALSSPPVHDDQKTEGEQETAEGTTDNRTTDEKWDEATKKEQHSAPTLIYPDQPETTNAPDIEVSRDRIHDEFKAVSILKINTTTLNVQDYKDNRGNYRIAGIGLNDNLNPDILNPDKLKAGTKITLELDREYRGKAKLHGFANRTEDVTFADYTGDDGSVKDPLNVPIKVMDENGRVLGYLPTWGWLMESFKGTSGPERMRNIVTLVNDGNGGMIDNLAAQQVRLSKLRRLISEAGSVQAVIENKGPGRVIMHVDNSGKTPRYTKAPATDMLPDKDLRLAIINQTTVNTAKNNPIAVTNSERELDRWHNAPVVVLPMANGEKTVAPLYMDDLDGPMDHASIERAIWLYLKSKDTNAQIELQHIFKTTGYDFKNPEHLRRYITQQFTYLQSFDDTHTAHNPNADSNAFLFNITDPATGFATVMVGFAHSGKKPIIANLKDGKLSPAFVEALREGLAMRQRNVNYTKGDIKGINNYEAFDELNFTPGGWKVVKHHDYNEYIKSHALTYVDGRNKLEGKYVYAANPMITFHDDVKVILKEDQTVNATLIPVKTDEVVTEKTEEQLGTDDVDRLNELFGFEARVKTPQPGVVVTSINPSLSMQPLSLDVLRDLHTFTKPSDRNGKTPEQVYEEMLKKNIPYIDSAHNPFDLKCG